MTFRTSFKRQKARRGNFTQTNPEWQSSKDSLKQYQNEEQASIAKAAKAQADELARPINEAKEATNKVICKLMAIRRANLDIVNQELVERCPVSTMTATTPDEYANQMLEAVRNGVAWNLSASEKQTLLSLAGVHKDVVNLTDSRVWTVLAAWCTECGVIKPAVQTETVAEPEPAPAPKETFDDVLQATSTDTREGSKTLKVAGQNDMYREASPLFSGWIDHLYRDYGFTPMFEDKKYILDVLFPRNNWSYLNSENYNRARRAMVFQGRWSDDLLNADEKLSRSMENENYTRDYETNREVNKQLLALRTNQ